jgi:hypothetical protein
MQKQPKESDSVLLFSVLVHYNITMLKLATTCIIIIIGSETLLFLHLSLLCGKFPPQTTLYMHAHGVTMGQNFVVGECPKAKI